MQITHKPPPFSPALLHGIQKAEPRGGTGSVCQRSVWPVDKAHIKDFILFNYPETMWQLIYLSYGAGGPLIAGNNHG